jgi:small subunit ribosomal protein S6
MKHYELMIVVHPDHSVRVDTLLEKYESIIAKFNGKIHRKEDLGRRQLAYSIKNVSKGHYILMNIEAESGVTSELIKSFNLNKDVIIRYLLTSKGSEVTQQSPLMAHELKRREKEEADNHRQAS